MQIVRELAGYSMGRSDLVRRAMSKKKHKVMEEERRNFIHGIVDESGNVEVPGCVRNGIREEIANKIFDQMMDFASYAFNKSHAAAYGVIGFQTGYLMRYYPTEYIAAMLNSVMGNNEKVAFYIRFANELGIQVLPPDVNESYAKFTVKDNNIRFGMAALKNAGFNVIESIVKSRELKGKFTSLSDFCNKIDISAVNKRAVESLIKAGAFDSFKIYRSQLLAVYERLLEGVHSEKKRNIEGQISLFIDFKDSIGNVKDLEVKYPNIKEFDKKYLLAMEKEMTGLYITGHPLEEYEETLNAQTDTRISDIVVNESLEEGEISEDSVSEDNVLVRDGDRVKIGGLIADISKKVTKNNDMMAFIRLEDMYGSIEAVVFPKVFEKCRSILDADSVVLVKGRVSIREDEQPKVLCESIEPLIKLSSDKVYVQIEDSKLAKVALVELRNIAQRYKGTAPMYVYVKSEKKMYRLDRDYWISTEVDALSELRNKFGDENIKIQ